MTDEMDATVQAVADGIGRAIEEKIRAADQRAERWMQRALRAEGVVADVRRALGEQPAAGDPDARCVACRVPIENCQIGVGCCEACDHRAADPARKIDREKLAQIISGKCEQFITDRSMWKITDAVIAHLEGGAA